MISYDIISHCIVYIKFLCLSAGKKEKITITNDKGRLSQDEIERMVAEAEEYAEQDKAIKAKIDARNKLETYCYNMKSTLSDKLGDKLDEDDKEKVSPLHPLSLLRLKKIEIALNHLQIRKECMIAEISNCNLIHSF